MFVSRVSVAFCFSVWLLEIFSLELYINVWTYKRGKLADFTFISSFRSISFVTKLKQLRICPSLSIYLNLLALLNHDALILSAFVAILTLLCLLIACFLLFNSESVRWILGLWHFEYNGLALVFFRFSIVEQNVDQLDGCFSYVLMDGNRHSRLLCADGFYLHTGHIEQASRAEMRLCF